MDRLGYDGVGFNEHHCSPYGLMNSPNLMAAAAAQRTKKLKLLIYGNLLPLHEPLRLAEELAMLDCLSNGRLISGFARGIPREYQVHNVPLAENRARASRKPTRSSPAPGPRRCSPTRASSGRTRTWRSGRARCSSPHPEIWIPIVGSKESIEFAGKHRHADHAGPGRRRLQRGHHPLLSPSASPTTATDHARPSLARQSRLCRRQQGARR